MSTEVRAAELRDAPAIGRIHVLSWQAAYKGLLPDGVLDKLDIRQRQRQWSQWLEQEQEQEKYTLVVLQAQELVGFACGGPVRGNFPELDGEIYAIYLAPDKQRQGLGRVLFQASQQVLRQAGLSRQLVWVLKENWPARQFYAAQGGQLSLERSHNLGSLEIPVNEVGYIWPNL